MVLSYHIAPFVVNITMKFGLLYYFFKVTSMFARIAVICSGSNPSKELFEVSDRGAYDRGQGERSEALRVTRICITTPEYPPEQWGGLARTVGKVAGHARELGLDVHVAHLAVTDEPLVLLDENRETREVDGITVHRLRIARAGLTAAELDLWECPHTLTLQMMYQSLEMLHKDYAFDCFHSFFLYPVGYVTGLLARRTRVPSVLTVVGNDVKKYPFSPEKAAVCRSGLENADRVVALSRDLMEMGDALAPIAQKCTIVYNSVSIPEEQWKLPPEGQGVFRIGCAGIFKYAKGLPYLFKAVAQVSRTRQVLLELRGTLRTSERDTYEAMVKKTGIKPVLSLLDPLPHEAVGRWLRGLDAFVLPSVSEGCPNILMEALASGVPSVATLTGANDELVDDHVSGLLVPWGNAQALATALEELAAQPDLAVRMGAAGRIRMKAFSAMREREAWELVYRGLINF